jgi:hypothetical protein
MIQFPTTKNTTLAAPRAIASLGQVPILLFLPGNAGPVWQNTSTRLL